jgi:hypothetical protein
MAAEREADCNERHRALVASAHMERAQTALWLLRGPILGLLRRLLARRRA